MNDTIKPHPLARIHSFQSLGAVDGPGLRYIIFLQGCPYHCPYCHNPDTQPQDDDETAYIHADAVTLCDRIRRYLPYFGKEGGVTVSGGEPLLQREFLADFFSECHRRGINTCLDTAGVYPDDMVHAVLRNTDTVMLDIKHPNADISRKTYGVDLNTTCAFLSACEAEGCRVWIRHVIVPGLTDSKDNLRAVVELVQKTKTLDKIELLPFRKLCMEKYKRLNLAFPLAETQECSEETLSGLNTFLLTLWNKDGTLTVRKS